MTRQTPDTANGAGTPGTADTEGPLDFLSPEWLQALEVALNEPHVGAGAAGEAGGAAIAVGQRVTGVPFAAGHEVRYTMSLGAEQARVTAGSVEAADVVIVTTYADAVALAAGERTAGSLLAAGGIKLSGDVARLVETLTLVERAAGATRSLRDRTTYR